MGAVAVPIAPNTSNQYTQFDQPYTANIQTEYQNITANKNIRHQFIMKVYTVLFCQLFVTFGLTLLFVLNQTIREFVQHSPGMLWTAIIMSFVFLFALVCCHSIAKTKPWNYIFLSLFTLSEGYMIGVVSSFFNTQSVGLALIITMSIVIGLTLFACQTKYDFTGMGPYLLCALIALMIFGIMNAIFCSYSCQVLNTVYSLIGALIFSMYIVYDTQMICGGTHKYQFDPDDYIFAALSIYLDIINLFLYILSLFKRN